MIRILLAEDQAMVRQGLKMMIETDKELKVVAEAKNGKQALELCEQYHIDLIVMDIRMPEMDGLEATRMIRHRWPERKLLILTTFNNDQYAIDALRYGANGYMLKGADAEQLNRSIHSCFHGGMSLEDQVAARVVPQLLKPVPAKLDQSFTPRELDIIKLVGIGKSNREIASELMLSVGTIKNHISQILEKAELRDRTQLAIYAIRQELV
ncbi:response regulator [Alkalicoccobacillus porphyridii]|uniref:Response regulator transcription factor n=1 Tax=Alkalicoccobacillus porphyridii TaxID=2597270 RepID=A0A553ZXR6_9BACI|nr:response regulator transcription factor [Alkalicoccobacillus porphyridii]TSB46195.1 response regulator transcription factor [Alkalicoccobacillus porphyridii]